MKISIWIALYVMFRFLKNTNRRQNERQTMEKFWLKWFAKK